MQVKPVRLLKVQLARSGALLALAIGVSAPRIIIAGATLAITRRTAMHKALLAPWHPAVS